jgi:mono/diheme cytochrome c family protein
MLCCDLSGREDQGRMGQTATTTIGLIGLAALLLTTAAHAPAWARQGPAIAAGRRIAQQNCGECHAVGRGPSPLPDAPPFRLLYQRYGSRTLGDLLQEGMLAGPRDEAAQPMHPRMPVVKLDPDQVSDLTVYLASLEPRRRRR